MIVDLLELHSLKNLGLEFKGLLDEFCSQVFNWYGIKTLKIVLADDWSNHCAAVALWEVFSKVLLNLILARVLLVFKGSFKVLFRRDLFILGVQ